MSLHRLLSRRFKQAMQPKSVAASFETTGQGHIGAHAGRNLLPQFRDERQQGRAVARGDPLQPDLVAPWEAVRNQPRGDAELKGEMKDRRGRRGGRHTRGSSANAWTAHFAAGPPP